MCGGPLLLEAGAIRDEPEGRVGIWRRRNLLPETSAAITLGEAGTPLVPLEVPGIQAEVWVKLESLNPTLSFKDRAMALGVSYGVDLRVEGLVVASTGNAAVSASAYAAAAGIACRVVVGSESAAGRKLDACRAFGATVEEIEGDYSAAYARAAQAEDAGWLNVSTTYRNPILAEAYRALAFELLEDLGTAPAMVVIPVGAGPLLRGVERGFADALSLGLIDSVPRLVAVQSAAVAPIVTEWIRRGRPHLGAELGGTRTAATAIADRLTGYEAHGVLTADAVERTGGAVLAVDETSIESSTRFLAHSGFSVEPSAATGLAALPALAGEAMAIDGPVVLMLTGHGSKVAPAA